MSLEERLRQQWRGGTPVANLIEAAKAEGLSITQSLQLIMRVCDMSLGEAKQVVAACPCWKAVIDAARPFHDELERVLAGGDSGALRAIERLSEIRLLATTEQVVEFDQILASLAGVVTERELPDLLRVFDDQTAHHEVMFGLVHFVEDFAADVELRALAIAMPELLSRAGGWVDTLNYRLINHDQAREVYKTVLSAQDAASAERLRDGLRRIASEAPPIGDRTRELLAT